MIEITGWDAHVASSSTLVRGDFLGQIEEWDKGGNTGVNEASLKKPHLIVRKVFSLLP